MKLSTTGKITTTALALAAAASTAPPASAATHDGGCPAAFQALTTAQQYALAEEVGVSPEEVAATIAKWDRNGDGHNGDGILCFGFPHDRGYPNIIDNNAH
jgi:hypothetical protein